MKFRHSSKYDPGIAPISCNNNADESEEFGAKAGNQITPPSLIQHYYARNEINKIASRYNHRFRQYKTYQLFSGLIILIFNTHKICLNELIVATHPVEIASDVLQENIIAHFSFYEPISGINIKFFYISYLLR